MEMVRDELERTIDSVYEDLRHSTPGSPEYIDALKAVDTITKLKIAEYQAEADVVNKEEDREIARQKLEEERRRNLNEVVLKVKEDKREKVKIGVGIGSTAASVAVYIWGLRRVTKFEDTGVITSKTFNLLPKLSNLFFKK